MEYGIYDILPVRLFNNSIRAFDVIIKGEHNMLAPGEDRLIATFYDHSYAHNFVVDSVERDEKFEKILKDSIERYGPAFKKLAEM